ncbi:hypothetical protein [Microbacterium paludicola]|uniref:hypothetical protein n=1 Tax=Microbacterium paludicola TaxID=300019 RepID=UPI001D167E18|nr:hypothetical protein [Microbacterium paludicola]
MVGRDAGELRDLLAAQARRAAPRPGGHAHVGRAQLFAAAAQEVGEGRSIDHRAILVPRGTLSQGEPVPG